MALYEVAGLFGTLVAETILASVHVRAHQQAGHMDASDLIKILQKHLARRGPSTYGLGTPNVGTESSWRPQLAIAHAKIRYVSASAEPTQKFAPKPTPRGIGFGGYVWLLRITLRLSSSTHRCLHHQ